MVDYVFSDTDNIIDATGPQYTWGDHIFAGLGDDHVTLGQGVTFVNEPGNDTVVGSDNMGSYGAWSDSNQINVNLQQGWVDDGFGGRDTLQGISTIHMTSLGGTVIGSDQNEYIFAFGGNATYQLGGGTDTVDFHGQMSDEFEIQHHAGVMVVFSSGGASVLHEVENLVFDEVTLNLPYESADIRADTSDVLHSFVETEMTEGWWYSGQYSEPQIVGYSPLPGISFDINADGYMDAIFSIGRGYATGVDTRMEFQVFVGGPEGLQYDASLTSEMPFVGPARRIEEIKIASSDQVALVSIGHQSTREGETDYDIPWRLGDLTIILPVPDFDIAADILPETGLNYTDLAGRTTAVNAHSMAVGDFDGDGVDDILVGDYADPFVLRQTLEGPWEVVRNTFLDGLFTGRFDPNDKDLSEGFLLDLHMSDFNGDGLDDIVAGWGPDRASSRIFFNDGSGDFSQENMTVLPASVYGDVSLHMRSYSEDFDGDGDLDLVILQSRDQPANSGNYLQYLENDGSGQFVDATDTRMGDAFPDEVRFTDFLDWTDHWEVADLNNDGALDFIGRDLEATNHVTMLVNDGAAFFTRYDLAIDVATLSMPLAVGDFDGDGLLEFMSMRGYGNGEGTADTTEFYVHEISTDDFTAQSLADLNENTITEHSPRVGDATNNVIDGGNLDDLIIALDGHDSVSGGKGDDQIFGGNGQDTVVGGDGDDALDGGEGIDRAVFDGPQAVYTLTLSASGTSRLSDRRADGSGTDRLSNLEFLDFDDTAGADGFQLFKQEGITGLKGVELESFVELYIAYFNRAPDAVGLGFWGTAFAEGLSLAEIAGLFINQPETRATYPDALSNEDFATAVYNNVLGRIPDQAGFDFWVGALNSGGVGKDQFILSVLGGAKADPQPGATQDFIVQQLVDRQYLTDKTDIGAYFSVHKGMSDVIDASAAMALFDGSAASIASAVNAIDGFYADALDPANGEFLLQLVGVLDDPFAMG